MGKESAVQSVRFKKWLGYVSNLETALLLKTQQNYYSP